MYNLEVKRLEVRYRREVRRRGCKSKSPISPCECSSSFRAFALRKENHFFLNLFFFFAMGTVHGPSRTLPPSFLPLDRLIGTSLVLEETGGLE